MTLRIINIPLGEGIEGIMSSSIVQLLNIYLAYIMEIVVYSFGSSFDVARRDK